MDQEPVVALRHSEMVKVFQPEARMPAVRATNLKVIQRVGLVHHNEHLAELANALLGIFSGTTKMVPGALLCLGEPLRAAPDKAPE